MTTFNEYRKAQEKLLENTLYTDPVTKQSFMADDKAVMAAFMFNFVGMLIGYNIIKDKKRVKTYFKNDLKLQLPNISDDNNNMSLIIKILDDKGAFKSATTAAKITRFLVKLKQGAIDEVDSDILIGWMNEIKENWWTKLNPQLKVTKEEFVIDKDQYKAFMNLRVRARVQTDVSKDFFDAFRGLNVEKSKITAWDVDMMSKKSIDQRLHHIATKQAVAPAAPAAPVQQTPTAQVATPITKPAPAAKAKIVKQDWPGVQAIITYFTDGGKYEDLNKYYKSTVEERRGALASSVRQVFSDVPEEKLVELGKFIVNSSTPKLLSAYIGEAIENMFRTNPISEKLLNRLIIAQNIGLLEKAQPEMSSGRYRYAVNSIFSTVVKEIFDFGAISRLRDVKEITSKINSNYLFPLQYANVNHRFVYEYIRLKTIDDFIKANYGKITVIDGVNTIKYTLNDDGFDYDNAVIKKIMSEYHLEKQSNDNVIVSYIATAGTSYGYGYELNKIIRSAFGDGPYNEVATKNIQGQFIKGIENSPNDAQALKTVKSLFAYLLEYNKELFDDVMINAFFKTIKERSAYASSDSLMDVFTYAIRLSNDRRIDPILITLLSGILKDPKPNFNDLIKNIRNAHSSTTPTMANFVRIVRDNSVLRKLAADKIIETALSNMVDDYYNAVYTHIGQRNNTWDILTPEQQTKLLNDMVIKLSELDINPSSNYRLRSGASTSLGEIKGNNSDFLYSNLTSEAKAAYKTLYKKINTLALADNLFFKELDDADLQVVSFNALNGAISKFDDADKAAMYNRFFAKPENKSSFADSKEASTLITILQVNEFTDVFKADIDKSIDNVFNQIKDTKRHYSATDVLQSISSKEYEKLSQEQKDKVFKRTLELVDDPNWIKKQTTNFKDMVPTVQEYFDSMVDKDRAGAQKIYDGMSYNMRLRMAESYLTRAGFSATIEGLLHNDESPIAPYEKLDKKRIKEILKYNNVSNAETRVPAKFTKTFDTMDDYIKTAKDNDYTHGKLEGQKVELLNVSEEDLDKISVDLHRNKRNGRHGDTTLKVLRSFKVSIPVQETEQKAWIEANPEQEIVNPMFHGTGSIGASMILRYGFRVIKSGDSLVVGRMLGDGIYGSNVIDKAQQYVGDKGFTRRAGTKGYIFKMNAALGKKDIDYRVAGLGTDSIRSPEWCVFTPNSQFKIYHAYEVELIDGYKMEELLKKYPQVVTEKSFKDYLNEKIEETVNYTTYTFINGVIPNGPNPEDVVDFSEWKSPSDKITIEPSAYGPTIVVMGTEENMDYTFTSVTDFRVNYPKEYEKFLKLFN